MGELKAGQSVGSWQSTLGKADITVKKEIGKGYASQDAAAKAAFGQEAVITLEDDGHYHAYTIDDGAYLDDLQLGEKVSLKKGIPHVQVLDVIGDDRFQLEATRKVMPPIGKDNGKVVYFLRRYEKGALNAVMDKVLDSAARWNEEIAWARKKGYTVVLDTNVTRDEMRAAFYDPKAAAIIFSGHGGNGRIFVDGGDGDDVKFGPNSLDKAKVSRNLKMVSFQSCETSKQEKKWQDVTHGARIDGWKRSMSALESAAANDPDWLGVTIGLANPVAGHLAPKLIPHRLDTLMQETL